MADDRQGRDFLDDLVCRCMKSLFVLGIDAPCSAPSAAQLTAACVEPANDGVLSIFKDANATCHFYRNLTLLHSFEGITDAVISLKYLAESDCVCSCLSNGDIWTIPVDEASNPDITGTIESGIKAACWSPDEELLVIVTGDDQLLLLTKDFQVLAENALRPSDFGEDKPVNVGWGHADTQFRGSIGKLSSRTTNVEQEQDTLDPSQDDFTPRISWRGDSAHFAVSCVDPSLPSTSKQGYKRVIRFYSRIAVLQSTSENCPGMEGPLAWQPSGSIIASTMRSHQDGKAKRDVIFFERNGLRRYDFPLRNSLQDSVRVHKLLWNSDSSLLAVHLETDNIHSVQLFTRNNYHWYLKQELFLPDDEEITNFEWHPEKAMLLYLWSSSVVQYTMAWEVIRANPDNSYAKVQSEEMGYVAVVDGDTLLCTPFRSQNIPPPMSSFQLTSKQLSNHVPMHCAFSSGQTLLAVLYRNGKIALYGCSTKEKPTHMRTVQADLKNCTPYQLAVLTDATSIHINIFAWQNNTHFLLSVRGSSLDDKISTSRTVLKNVIPRRITCSTDKFWLVDRDGQLLDANSPLQSTSPQGPPTRPLHTSVLQPPESSCMSDEVILVSLSETGRLYARTQLLDNQCTSFIICGRFLIYTTATHLLRFLPLSSLTSSRLSTIDVSECEERRIERGSKIVTAVASVMSVVLQMPRGNLEIIYPRPLVLDVVRQHVKEGSYREAFIHCRKHRIDLNLLCDLNLAKFLANLEEFIDQLHEVDHLNLFLSSLKKSAYPSDSQRELDPEDDSDLHPDKVNRLCQAMRSVLLTKDLSVYLNSILTTYVCQQPPDYESALQAVSDVKSTNADLVDDAVKYMIFLSDANKLYEVALGVYDLQLVLLVAQQSQKDPKEYVPFLREIKQLEPHMQHFKIDDHLKRRTKALQSLVLAGPSHFQEVQQYVTMFELYEEALGHYRHDTSSLKVMHQLFADHLLHNTKYSEAGLNYALAGRRDDAINAYVLANEWQEVFALALAAVNNPTSKEAPFKISRIPSLAMDVATRLRSSSRYAEASRVLLDYAQDVEASVRASCEGHHYKEAIRIAYLYSQATLIETDIAPAMLEAVDMQMDTINDLSTQIAKQVARLDELAIIKSKDVDAYYGTVDLSGLDGVDVDDSASTVAGTMFTRYTAAPTQVTRLTNGTGTTGRSRKKDAKRKQGGQKKGSIWEEDYLLGSLCRTFETRVEQLQKDVGDLLPSLLTIGQPSQIVHNKCQGLQLRLKAFEDQCKTAIAHVWDKRADELAKHDVVGMIKRPKLPNVKWAVAIL